MTLDRPAAATIVSHLLCASILLGAQSSARAAPQGSEQPDSGPMEMPARKAITVASPGEILEERVLPPTGYTRIAVRPGSFGAWLRRLPTRPGRPDVRLHDGRRKANQDAHHLVFDIDVGRGDLQQCADAVMRLRAEYLLSGGCRNEIRFSFTSGDVATWTDWLAGSRPRVSGNRVRWVREAAADSSYATFRGYLDTVFTYAGSASLDRDLLPVPDPSRPDPGDIFIQGGFPGHAVIVIDVAENGEGERMFLLAQSYMPAQEIHLLRSFEADSPWFPARADGVLRTPEWVFSYLDLKRFAATDCDPPAEPE